jgi:hypothetical protein
MSKDKDFAVMKLRGLATRLPHVKSSPESDSAPSTNSLTDTMSSGVRSHPPSGNVTMPILEVKAMQIFD